MENSQDNYKHALSTLISAQELIIKYSRKELISNICWGVLLFLFGVLPPYNFIWINVLCLIVAGLKFHWAVKEHEYLKLFKEDLELLELLKEKTFNKSN